MYLLHGVVFSNVINFLCLKSANYLKNMTLFDMIKQRFTMRVCESKCKSLVENKFANEDNNLGKTFSTSHFRLLFCIGGAKK